MSSRAPTVDLPRSFSLSRTGLGAGAGGGVWRLTWRTSSIRPLKWSATPINSADRPDDEALRDSFSRTQAPSVSSALTPDMSSVTVLDRSTSAPTDRDNVSSIDTFAAIHGPSGHNFSSSPEGLANNSGSEFTLPPHRANRIRIQPIILGQHVATGLTCLKTTPHLPP